LSRGAFDRWLLAISTVALAAARGSLGADAARIHWVEADVTRMELPPAQFDI
jgi:hypothetical protein